MVGRTGARSSSPRRSAPTRSTRSAPARPGSTRCCGAFPPGALRHFEPEHLLVGHGRGVHGPAATAALRDAYERSRSDIPKLALKLPGMLKAVVANR